MVELFCELRKSKGVTPEQAAKTLKKNNYFGTMLVKMGGADCLLGGATYSTADTVRPALQLIKTKSSHVFLASALSFFQYAANAETPVAINCHENGRFNNLSFCNLTLFFWT